MRPTPPKYPRYSGKEPCRSTDPEAFYPEVANKSHMDTLKEICMFCPSREPCAEYAIWFEAEGFWGGLSPLERRAIRRKRNIVIRQSERDYAA